MTTTKRMVCWLVFGIGVVASTLIRADGPPPPPIINLFFFDDTNVVDAWGLPPITVSNVFLVPSWDSNAVEIANTEPAILRYREIQDTGYPNILCDEGTVYMWFQPYWSSTNLGGPGPGTCARFVELGTLTDDASIGWWSLYTDPEGCHLYFAAQTNGSEELYLATPVEFSSNQWYQVALTYTPSNSAIYLNDQLLTNGTGVTYWPSATVRSNGFCVGSDGTGVAQVQGQIDFMILCDYAWSEAEVLDWYDCISAYAAGQGDSMQGGGEEQMGGLGWLTEQSSQMSLPANCTEPTLAANLTNQTNLVISFCGLGTNFYDLVVTTNLTASVTTNSYSVAYWQWVTEVQTNQTSYTFTNVLSWPTRFFRLVKVLEPERLQPNFYVTTNALPGWDGSRDLPFPNLEAALTNTAVVSGSVIQVAPGVYSGPTNRNLTFGGKQLVLISERGWESTLIDCGADGNRAFSFTSQTEDFGAKIIGFTISNAGNSAVYCATDSAPAFVNCSFVKNASSDGGGAIYITNAAPVFANCRFSSNSATTFGGAIYARGSNTTLRVTHSTFNNNTRASGGGMICATNGAWLELNNCIVWSQTNPEIVTNDCRVVTVTYCDVYNVVYAGTGNTNTAPGFETTGSLRLTNNAACIDRGTTNSLPGLRRVTLYDMDGEARLAHDGGANEPSTTDIGADEFVYRIQFPTNTQTVYVPQPDGSFRAEDRLVSDVDEASGVAYLGNSATGPVIAVVDDEHRTTMQICQLNTDASAIAAYVPISVANTVYTNAADQEIGDMEGLTFDSGSTNLYLITSQTRRNRFRNVDSSPPILDPVVDPPSNDYDRRRSVLARLRLDASLTNVTTRTYFESEYVPVPYNTDYFPTNGLAAHMRLQLTNSNVLLRETNHGNKVLIAWNTVNKFGTPVKGDSYATNTSLPYPNGGTAATAGTSLGIFDPGSESGTITHLGRSAGSNYYYKIWAVDTEMTYYEGPTRCVTNDGLPLIYINEFDGAGDNETVEFYNPSPVAVNIGGCILSDNPYLTNNTYTIPAGTNIPARGVWAVNDPTVNWTFHFENNGSENIYIFWTNRTTRLDEWNMSAQGGNGYEGRAWDGGPRGFQSITQAFGSCLYSNLTPPSPYPQNLYSLNLTQAYKRFDAVADIDQTKIYLAWQNIGLVPSVGNYSPKQHDFHSINIEDIAFKGVSSEIVFGLRAPLVSRTSSNAYYFVATNLSTFLPAQGWSNGPVQGIGGALQMDLGGMGIRSIKWCPSGLTNAQGTQVGRYLVLAGNANGGPLVRERARQKFSVYAWDGSSSSGVAHPQLLIADLIGYAVRPEGVELINISGQWRILFVEDRYQTTGYATRNAIHWPVNILGVVQ
jgi:predicted outer membrane repeat protein